MMIFTIMIKIYRFTWTISWIFDLLVNSCKSSESWTLMPRRSISAGCDRLRCMKCSIYVTRSIHFSQIITFLFTDNLLCNIFQILWAECGWRPVSLTDMITPVSVKKVYNKANLYVHPDKVQQRGATLQQKYIAEKVFDLLKVLISAPVFRNLSFTKLKDIYVDILAHVILCFNRKRGTNLVPRNCDKLVGDENSYAKLSRWDQIGIFV